jgi:predicted GNAT family N-acyltransferase
LSGRSEGFRSRDRTDAYEYQSGLRPRSGEPVEDLLALYRTYDWWADRTEGDLRRALRHTDELVTLRDRETDTVVAAARVLTDYVYYAMVYDVIVEADHREEGFGRRLIEAVIDHPDLTETRGLSLLCREGLVPFYASYGFEIGNETVVHPDGAPEPLRWMRYQHERK